MTDQTPIIVTVPATSTGTGSGIVQPDLRPVYMHAVAPLLIVAVRVLKTYLESLLGLMTAGVVAPDVIVASDFMHLLIKCASLAVAPAGFTFIRNVLELLTKFDQSHPTLSV